MTAVSPSSCTTRTASPWISPGTSAASADLRLTRLGENNEFVGYDVQKVEGAKVLALYRDGTAVESATAGEDVVVVLDMTPFYAEMGGQVGDTGVLENSTTLLQVNDTFKIKASVFGHSAHIKEGTIALGDVLNAEIDTQIAEVERIVNAEILANTETLCRDLPIEEAKKTGAVMLFGEKYGTHVRVMTIGTSVEFCGGTHVKRTGEIGAFKILGEAGISAGVRRLEAVTGMNAVRLMQKNAGLLAQAAARFKTPAEELPGKIDHLIGQVKDLEKALEQAKAKLAAMQGADIVNRAEDIAGVKVLLATLEGVDVKTLRQTMDDLKARFGSAVEGSHRPREGGRARELRRPAGRRQGRRQA